MSTICILSVDAFEFVLQNLSGVEMSPYCAPEWIHKSDDILCYYILQQNPN